MEELDSKYSSSFDLIVTKSDSARKVGSYSLSRRNLVWNRTGSNYLFSVSLSYVPSNGEKNQC